MNPGKTFILTLLISAGMAGCASQVSAVPTSQASQTSITSPAMALTTIPEDATHCYFANLGDPENHPCSVAQLESVLDFDVKELTVDPLPLVLIKGAWTGPSEEPKEFDIAELLYKCPNEECALLFIQIPAASADKTNLIDWGKTPASAVEKVELKAGTGEYVKGWFYQPQPGQPEVWSAELETQRLVWVEGDVLFTLAMDGNSSSTPLGKEELVALANGSK